MVAALRLTQRHGFAVSDVSCCHVAFWSPATCAGWTLACESARLFHTPLGFLELPLLACAVGFHRASFSARSRLRILWMLFLMLSIYGLKQQYMVKTGSMLSWMAR